MKRMKFLCAGLLCVFLKTDSPAQSTSRTESNKTLPALLAKNHNDLIEKRARYNAAVQFSAHRLPDNLKDWMVYRDQLRMTIAEKTGAILEQDLPLDMRETRVLKAPGMTVKNIMFQTRPGIYATANLYIPDGKGPFPAAVVMAGHSRTGRMAYHYLGCTLAMNGFAALAIDPWGSGERTTKHGAFEYHGANLGASLMNVGDSLMGLQITDNMRAVELLRSLSFVDPEKVGATGASGGGNQTMWLAAMDERVKAAVPVVSVGTFESYVMGHNCICEVLIDGLTFTEESGVLALVAPRALLLSNGLKDSNPAFYPSEMMRSFENAMPIFELYGAGDKFSHLVFDGPHSYPPETREGMVKLFNTHLKGIPAGQTEIVIPEKDNCPLQEDIMVFEVGKRDEKVISTAEFCRQKGRELRQSYLANTSFNTSDKQRQLKAILKIDSFPNLTKINKMSTTSGWEIVTLETSDSKLIPLWHRVPAKGSSEYVILSTPDGANTLPSSILDALTAGDAGVVLVDLSGTGAATSALSKSNDRLAKLHTLARANLWLGKTVMGEWAKELDAVTKFIASERKSPKISFDGTREAGLAGLFLAAVGGNLNAITLRDAPASYLFDDRDAIDFFSMGVNVPGILKWGDVSLAAALSGKEVTFVNPVTMSGHTISNEKIAPYQSEFTRIRKACKMKGATSFQ